MAQQAYAPFLRRWIERVPPLRFLVWGFEAAFLGTIWAVFACLPPARASALGRALLTRIGPRLRKHRHVRRNLRIALPERTPAEIEAIARESWGSAGAVLGEFPHLARIARERMEVVSAVDLAALRERGRPIVFVTAHYGNWELTTLAIARLGIPLAVIYSPDSNPWIDRQIRRRRRALGCALVSKEGGVRALLRALEEGRSVGLVVDTRQDEGEAIPFFGREALTSTVPARLAVRGGFDLVPIRAERIGDARFRVTFEEPVRPVPGIEEPRAQARAMSRAVHARFEAWIREHPEQWMCSKRRWPEDEKKGEEEGRAAASRPASGALEAR